ncbi:MAG: histidinol dehydrogenase [Gemmatimonadetes bacterium]|nr:histidinol dehydrogenase [Gemmatimonadota bacterium]NNM05295.1 histidinol dehydrogenase [Gemmatimonadota bacterium]
MKINLDKKLSDLTPLETRGLVSRRPSDEPQLRARVSDLLSRVQRQGDHALKAMAEEFDGVALEELEVPRDRWEAAVAELDPKLRGDLEMAAENIKIFHRAQIPEELQVTVRPGVTLGRRAVPLSRVGVYAPGGRAAYPSSVLMGVVPAKAAGVEEIILCSPPGPSGAPPAEVMAAASIGGASRLFALGGAGAIGALAYGTDQVPAVDAIVGPGNRYVTEAKRQVAGDVLIDSPAGPSEVLVVADAGADPRLCALELICQAEHDPDAAVALVTDSTSLLEAVRRALASEVEKAPRRDIVEAALSSQGALLLADRWEDVLQFAKDYSAEHLALFTADPRSDMEAAQTAGTVFLGQAAAVAYGDYITGANHVLPTGGLARTFSSLSTLHYLRMYTWQEITPEAASAMSGAVERMAESEGLPGHAEAARARKGPPR